ncbi:MAG: ribose-phosphate pyrophosphokinase [Rhizobiales bacterium]|nr:ribose-phosphate pyrophosphokinase [Hyphomicrobiales bacterium]
MTPSIFIAMPGNEAAAGTLAKAYGATIGQLELRAFPDGESYLRFDTDLTRRTLAIVCSLDRPNDKILPLLFAAATARELGAAKVGLVAPYLAYMRQDRRFKPGEAVTSREVAQLLSNAFDWLVTVDPHLHRYGSLSEIYSIPTRVVHAASLMADWIKTNVANALIIGPDSESEQWVSTVAKDAGAPYTVLEKVRRGDREVEISIRNLGDVGERTPVLVDDIISTGRTMLETVRLLKARGDAAPVCVAVHGLFAADAYEMLIKAGARVVTCNTVRHTSNAIDVHGTLAKALGTLSVSTD